MTNKKKQCIDVKNNFNENERSHFTLHEMEQNRLGRSWIYLLQVTHEAAFLDFVEGLASFACGLEFKCIAFSPFILYVYCQSITKKVKQ